MFVCACIWSSKDSVVAKQVQCLSGSDGVVTRVALGIHKWILSSRAEYLSQTFVTSFNLPVYFTRTPLLFCT